SPAPVRMTTQTSGSRSIERRASSSAAVSDRLTALRTAGRVTVSVRMCPSRDRSRLEAGAVTCNLARPDLVPRGNAEQVLGWRQFSSRGREHRRHTRRHPGAEGAVDERGLPGDEGDDSRLVHRGDRLDPQDVPVGPGTAGCYSHDRDGYGHDEI